MGTLDPTWDYDYMCSIYNIKEMFGNRNNFYKWRVKMQEIELNLHAKTLSLGDYKGELFNFYVKPITWN